MNDAVAPAGRVPGALRAWLASLARQRVPAWLLSSVLGPFLLTRLLLALAGLAALRLLPRPAALNGGQGDLASLPWVNVWARWDAGWYLSVASHGYHLQPGAQSNVAFSPLYPLLMRLVGLLLGRVDDDGLLIAGLVVSNAALLAALVYLIRLARLDVPEAVAQRVPLFLLVFPTSLYLSAVYAESLFLALCVAAFYHARQHQWWLAGLLGGLAALARPYGVVIALPLALEYLAAHQLRLPRLRPDALALALTPAGFVVWTAILLVATGDPLAFLHGYSAWGVEQTLPWTKLVEYVSAPPSLSVPEHSPFILIFLAASLLLAGAAWRRLRLSLALFATLLLVVMLSNGDLVDLPRHVLELFPAFLVLALVGRSRRFRLVYVPAALLVSLEFMAVFASGYWLS